MERHGGAAGRGDRDRVAPGASPAGAAGHISRIAASRSVKTGLLVAAACLVLGELVVRGPWRALHGNSQDLAVHYAAARLWVAGGNPYDMRQIGDAFLAGHGPARLVPTERTMPSVYPSVTLLVEAPLAVFDWEGAVRAFQAITAALLAGALLLLLRAVGLRGERAGWMVVAALAFAPLQTALAEGQVVLPSAALLIASWALAPTHAVASGVLLALGAAVKPPLAFPFAIAVLARPRWKALITAAVTFAALFACAEARLALAGQPGVATWLARVAAASGPGGMNFPAPGNPASVTMLHLPMLVLRIANVPALATVFTLAVTIPLLAIGARSFHKAASAPTRAWALSLLCVASLLAMYHRTYDAVLLWVPLATALAQWRELPHAARLLAIVTLAAFAIPGPAALAELAASGAVPARVTRGVAWRALLVPYQVWMLLLVAVALTWGLLSRADPLAGPAVGRMRERTGGRLASFRGH